MRTCSVPECASTVTGRGWCAKHYWRFRTYGDLDHVRTYPSLEERFWAKVERASGACWLWTAGVRGDGYGAFNVAGKQLGAHRYSYELHNGPIPTGMVIMHICDVPTCVNPAHLRLGTNAENCADSARKARRPRGSRNSQSKLTEGQVLEIRRLYAEGAGTQKQLAAAFGVSDALVCFIVTRRAWRHI